MSDSLIKQSPIHHLLELQQPEWSQQTEIPIVLRYHSDADERATMQTLGLCDLSGLSKLGIKGLNSDSWLRKQGIDVPETSYESRRLADDGYIVRIAADEFFLESGPRNEVVLSVDAQLKSNGHPLVRVERQDATFLLVGSRAIEVLLQTCGVNFREVPSRYLVFTRVAGVSCAVLPELIEGLPAYRLWFDSSFAVSMWQTLSEICEDLNGGIIGAGCVIPGLA